MRSVPQYPEATFSFAQRFSASEPPGVKVRFAGTQHPVPAEPAAARGAPWFAVIALGLIAIALAVMLLAR